VKSTADPLFRTGRPLARTFGDGVACLFVLVNDFTYIFYTGIRATFRRVRHSARGSITKHPNQPATTSQPARSSPTAKQSNQAPNVAKKNQANDRQKVFFHISSSRSPSQERSHKHSRRHIQLRVGCYQVSSPNWLVCFSTRQTKPVATESSDPSFLHACILATHAFPPAFRIQDGPLGSMCRASAWMHRYVRCLVIGRQGTDI
jgi:hypothetical protein